MLAGIEKCDTVFQAFKIAADFGPYNDLIHVPYSACAAYRSTSITLTYSEALAAAESAAADYAAAGFGPTHRIALALDNRAEFFVHFLAMNKLGVAVVPLNMELSNDELAYVLDHSDSAAVVALSEYAKRLESIAAGISETVNVISPNKIRASAIRPTRTIATGCPSEGGEAALLYTSGTTGKPKGCVLSNAHFLRMGQWYTTVGGLCAVELGVERLVTPLPLFHANALVCSFMAMIHCGGCVVQLDRFHPSKWWSTVRAARATIVHYLGVMPAMLLTKPAESGEDFSEQVRFGFGAGVDPRHQMVFEQRFGFPLVEAWAMTETGAAAVIAANEEPRHVGQRCFGRPGSDIEHRIVDESGNDVSVEVPGELLVRRSGDDPREFFFSGYYKDVEATEEAWQDGWLHTGDVVRADPEGSLFFVDRRKNIIRRSGENIAAVEVEGVLLKHAAIESCAVAPVPDEIRGEEVAACIVVRAGQIPDQSLADDIFRACYSELAYFKTPGYVIFLENLPMTGSQKVQRGKLKQLARGSVEDGKTYDMTALKKRPARAMHE